MRGSQLSQVGKGVTERGERKEERERVESKKQPLRWNLGETEKKMLHPESERTVANEQTNKRGRRGRFIIYLFIWLFNLVRY